MQLFLRGQDTHSVEVGDECVSFLKTVIAEAEKIPIEDQVLFYGGNPLADDDKIASCLADGATIDVCCRLKGGKVHGSLARAGKRSEQSKRSAKSSKATAQNICQLLDTIN